MGFMRLYYRFAALAVLAVFAFVFVGGLAGHNLIVGVIAAALAVGLAFWGLRRADQMRRKTNA
jgi:Flp pilus assembly protein TadB